MSQAGLDAAITTVDEIAPEPRQALRDLILALADSKRILGIRFEAACSSKG